jgi:hypothetical protein
VPHFKRARKPAVSLFQAVFVAIGGTGGTVAFVTQGKLTLAKRPQV